MIQKERLFSFLGSLMRVGLSLMENVLTPLTKSVLIPLGVMVLASITNAAIQKKLYGLGIFPGMLARASKDSDRSRPLDIAKQTAQIISNEEMKNIMKRIKSLQEYGLLIKGVSETIESEEIEQNGWFLSMFLATLAASIKKNMLTGKGVTWAGEGTIRTSQDF